MRYINDVEHLIYAARKAVAAAVELHPSKQTTNKSSQPPQFRPARPIHAIHTSSAFSYAIALTAERLDFAIAYNAHINY